MIDNTQLAGGGRIELPVGRFVIDPVTIPLVMATDKKQGHVVEVSGVGGYGVHNATILYVRRDGDKPAISVYSHGSALRGFMIQPLDLNDAPPVGVYIAATMTVVSRVTAHRFPDKAFWIHGPGSAQTAFQNLVEGCRGSFSRVGIHVDGYSAGVTRIVGNDFRQSKEVAIWEDGNSGNLYIGNHTSGQGTATDKPLSIRVTGASNYSHFSGNYMENDQEPPEVENYWTTAAGGNVALRWPEGRPNLSYYGDVRNEAYGSIVKIPNAKAPITIRHGENKVLNLMQPYSGSLPWFKDTHILLRRASDAFAPFAMTNEDHPDGPDLAVYGSASKATHFRGVVSTTLSATAAGDHEIKVQHAYFADDYPGRAVIRPDVHPVTPASAPAWVISSRKDAANKRGYFIIRTEPIFDISTASLVDLWHI
jgi:hypothetical protein